MSNTISITAKKYTIEFLCNVGSIYSRHVILGDTEAEKMMGHPIEEFSEDFDTEQLSRILKISGLNIHLNIHCQKDMPLLMTSKIGIIGNIQIYIKSRRQLDEESLQN
jgi:hypothetical protein